VQRVNFVQFHQVKKKGGHGLRPGQHGKKRFCIQIRLDGYVDIGYFRKFV
jgi:hypothetical protein